MVAPMKVIRWQVEAELLAKLPRRAMRSLRLADAWRADGQSEAIFPALKVVAWLVTYNARPRRQNYSATRFSLSRGAQWPALGQAATSAAQGGEA
jgi:hypothetical protein